MSMIVTEQGQVDTPIPLPLADGTPSEVPTEVMLARTGTWLGHPAAPQIIGRPHLRSALDYFRRHYAAHGADLVVDYHHASILAPPEGGAAPAAGWITGMELRSDGAELWGRVLWTAEAAQAVAARRFRHLSPVFRFNVPDRVTGETVPMVIHSVALTNTPFLTELRSLNEAAAAPTPEGGESMTVCRILADALGLAPEEVAARLGLAPDAGDVEVAQAVMALIARLGEMEARAASPAVADALGVPPDADETALRAAIVRLRAPRPEQSALCEALGLPGEAGSVEVLGAVADLKQAHERRRAEEVVDAAVREGRVPPAHREFYLREALRDLGAARQVVNSLPVLTGPAAARGPGRLTRGLTAAEESVCRQLGLSEEAYLRAAE